MKHTYPTVFLIVLAFFGAYFIINLSPKKDDNMDIISGESPAIVPPAQVRTDQPVLLEPVSGSTIIGPLVVRGYVPKSWTFEGQFRIKVLDGARRLVFSDSVPVEVDDSSNNKTLYFVESYNIHTDSQVGYIVLLNDNPSGLEENSRQIEIPVNFSLPKTKQYYIYIWDKKEDTLMGGGQPLCRVVLPEKIVLDNSTTPITDIINSLSLRIHPDFYLKGVNLDSKGILTLEFPVIPGLTSGGSCAQNIHRLEISKTAGQFSQVKQVRFLPPEIFQP